MIMILPATLSTINFLVTFIIYIHHKLYCKYNTVFREIKFSDDLQPIYIYLIIVYFLYIFSQPLVFLYFLNFFIKNPV